MAHIVNDATIKAAAVYAGSQMPRNLAVSELATGTLAVIFSVDLVNEGTDLPDGCFINQDPILIPLIDKLR